MGLSNFIKRIQDVIRKDKGVGTNEVLILEQLTWLLFLYVYDYKEEEWEFHDESYESIIPECFRWRNWGADNKDGMSLTGDNLLEFIDRELLPALKNLEMDEKTERKQAIVKAIFEDSNNYIKNGTSMRKVINIINELDFDEVDERHSFNDIYETLLKSLQSAGNNGQYFI